MTDTTTHDDRYWAAIVADHAQQRPDAVLRLVDEEVSATLALATSTALTIEAAWLTEHADEWGHSSQFRVGFASAASWVRMHAERAARDEVAP